MSLIDELRAAAPPVPWRPDLCGLPVCKWTSPSGGDSRIWFDGPEHGIWHYTIDTCDIVIGDGGVEVATGREVGGYGRNGAECWARIVSDVRALRLELPAGWLPAGAWDEEAQQVHPTGARHTEEAA